MMIRTAIIVIRDWLFNVRYLRHRKADPSLCVVAGVDPAVRDQALDVICDAFLIPERQRYCLRPNDELMAIYKSPYRFPFCAGDALEFVTLVMNLEDLPGIDVSDEEFVAIKTVADVVHIVSRSRPCP